MKSLTEEEVIKVNIEDLGEILVEIYLRGYKDAANTILQFADDEATQNDLKKRFLNNISVKFGSQVGA